MLPTDLAIASKRDHRDFDPTPLPEQIVDRILDAGRLAGSARNLQPWRFVTATSRPARESLARAVYVPGLVLSAPLAIVVIAETAHSRLALMDAGRAAQNMMLAAWAEGVASCPNGIAQPAALEGLGLTETEDVPMIIALGLPRTPRSPTRRSRDQWSARANRRPLSHVVSTLDDGPTSG